MAEELDTSFDDKFTTELQKKFISLLVFDKPWATMVGFDLVQPQYFENTILRNICKWIHEYYKQYKALPTAEILKEQAREYAGNTASGIKSYLAYEDNIKEIFTRDDNDNTEYYKDRVQVFIRQAAWKQALEKGTDVLRNQNYEAALNEFKKVLSIGGDPDLGTDFSEMSLDSFLETLANAYDPSSMIKTGIPSWDKALGGGFVKNNLHIIGAPPGGGKSRTMAFLAKNALKDRKRVIFFTLELTENETITNIETASTGMYAGEMLTPESRNEFKQRATAFKQQYGSDLFVKFYRPATVTADTLHNYIQRVIKYRTEKLGYDWKPDVIFLDYMDKLLPTQKIRGNSYEDVGGVADDCKNLAIAFDCPVVTGSQLGRFSWVLNGSEVVTMDSIAESAKKVHLAHSMTTINQNKGEKDAHLARLFLAKSRTGRPGSIAWCAYDLGKCALTEIPPWDPTTLNATSAYNIKDTSHR